MSNADERRATNRKTLPPKFVHEMRNALGVAIGLTDLLSLATLPPGQAADVGKIREACLRAAEILERWDQPSRRRVALLVLSLLTAA